MNSLWEIDGGCSLANCGKLHSIYTYRLTDADPDSIVHSFLSMNPHIPCLGGHPAKFQRDHLSANRLNMAQL